MRVPRTISIDQPDKKFLRPIRNGRMERERICSLWSGAERSGFGDSVLESRGHGTGCLVPIATLIAWL